MFASPGLQVAGPHFRLTGPCRSSGRVFGSPGHAGRQAAFSARRAMRIVRPRDEKKPVLVKGRASVSDKPRLTTCYSIQSYAFPITEGIPSRLTAFSRQLRSDLPQSLFAPGSHPPRLAGPFKAAYCLPHGLCGIARSAKRSVNSFIIRRRGGKVKGDSARLRASSYSAAQVRVHAAQTVRTGFGRRSGFAKRTRNTRSPVAGQGVTSNELLPAAFE